MCKLSLKAFLEEVINQVFREENNLKLGKIVDRGEKRY